MEIIYNLLGILLALGLLTAGAEALVRGSSSLAKRMGISPLAVGLTVVAYGTSAPELVVSLQSVLGGKSEIAVGNVVGSNIFNIGIILGLTALLSPVPVKSSVVKLDAPLMLIVALVGALLLMDGSVGRLSGSLLLLGGIGYTVWNLILAGKEEGVTAEVIAEKPSNSLWLDIAFIAVGLALLAGGSTVLVGNASVLARALGVGESVIGLTIVSAGTSMPELATSVMAALRRQPDIAIGNIVGSNIFNILGILGISAVVVPINVSGIGFLDLGTMLLLSILLLPLMWSGLVLRRLEGVALLVVYFVYLWLVWP